MDALYFNQFTTNDYPTLDLDGCDGPYLSVSNDAIQVLQVNERGDIITEIINQGSKALPCFVDNEDGDSFPVRINTNAIPSQSAKFDASSRIIVISDIEGNFNALYSLLVANEVMNTSYEWTLADGQLVLLGDVMDKGKNVTQCMWLIYHLENQAHKYGGSVHFILGNHDVMNLTLDVRYVHEKYLALAQKVTQIDNPPLAYWHLMKRNTILMTWMKSKNCMEQIGDTLFVHAGISQQILDEELDIKNLNDIFRRYINDEWPANDLTELVFGKFGPLWYRGMVTNMNDEGKLDETIVDQVLDFYRVNRIVLGHTLVDAVSTDYHGKVVRVDVKHSDIKSSQESQGLLIEDDKFYAVNGAGKKKLLNETKMT